MVDEGTTYRLADYPVLARLANDKTKAARLDARACRYIYASGVLSTKDFSAKEQRFYDSIHKCA